MVKVGIIGCGKIAQVRHIPEYLDNPNAKLTGLYDLNLQRAKELAEKYDCKSYESVEEMLTDPEMCGKSCTCRDYDCSIKSRKTCTL